VTSRHHHHYVIAGFHRSGTSMVAKALQRCGVALGPVLIPPLASNPTGHFEDWDMVELHESILQDAGSNWLHAGPLPPVGERHLAAMRALAADRDARYPAWGFKDPRVCLFLDAWRVVLPDAYVLGVVRHWTRCLDSLRDRAALEIALAPAQSRAQIPLWTQPTRALESWLVHTRAILDHARRHPARTRVITQDTAMNPGALHAILMTVPGLAPPLPSALGIEPAFGDRDAEPPSWVPPALRAALDALWSDCIAATRVPAAALAVSRPELVTVAPRPDEDSAVQPAAAGAVARNADSRGAEGDGAAVDALARQADACIARRDLDEGERLARQCVARSPWVGEHHVRLGVCRMHRGRLDEAEVYILRGIALGPAKPHFWAQLASLCQRAGRVEEAQRHIARAIEQDPAHPWFRIVASQLEQRLGRFDASVAAARTAVDLDGANVVAHLRLFDALVRAGRVAEAADAAAAARARFPHDDEVARREARTLWIEGRIAEAQAMERVQMAANLAALAAGPARDDPRNRVTDPAQRADLERRIERALHGHRAAAGATRTAT